MLRGIERKPLQIAVACAALVGTQGTTSAQSELETFRHNWQEAASYAPTAELYICWEETLYPDPALGLAALEAMAARVEGHPDHPERGILEDERRRRAQGPDIVRTEVWYTDLKNMRFSRTELWHDLYMDVCSTDEVNWSLVPSQLTIADPRYPAPQRDYTSFSGEFQRMLRKLAWGGFGSALTPVNASVGAETWVVRAADPAYSTVEWECESTDGRLIPNRSRVIEAPGFPDAVGSTTVYENWRQDPALGNWIAGNFIEYSAAGGKVREVTLREIRELKSGEFASVTAIPGVLDADVLRGIPTFKAIMDFRPGIEKRTLLQGDGQVAEFAIPSDQLGRAPTRWIRRLGWGAAGLIVAILVGIRIVRGRSSV